MIFFLRQTFDLPQLASNKSNHWNDLSHSHWILQLTRANNNGILFIWSDYTGLVPICLVGGSGVLAADAVCQKSVWRWKQRASKQHWRFKQTEKEQWLFQACILFHREQCLVCGTFPCTWKTTYASARHCTHFCDILAPSALKCVGGKTSLCMASNASPTLKDLWSEYNIIT